MGINLLKEKLRLHTADGYTHLDKRYNHYSRPQNSHFPAAGLITEGLIQLRQLVGFKHRLMNSQYLLSIDIAKTEIHPIFQINDKSSQEIFTSLEEIVFSAIAVKYLFQSMLYFNRIEGFDT